jgi:hypothetical protein
MKKILLGAITLLMTSQPLSVYARGGGDAAVGALGGLAVGTMIGHATANSGDPHRATRAEQEAVRAQDKADRVQIEQERQRIAQIEREIDRRDTERQLQEARAAAASQSANPMMVTLMILVGLLTLIVVGLAVVVLRRKQ